MATVIDFCTPAVPGEVHKYYGDSHNKFLKLPHIPPASQTPKKVANKKSELKTLRSVALYGDLRLLRHFLEMVPDKIKAVNEPHPATGLTCLHFAASQGHLKFIQCLVEEYAVRVDSTDKEGETALLKAAYNGHYHVVEYLLNSNANIHHKDKDGWTALHNACSRGYIRIVRLLIERKAKVEARSKMGHTPLINAASKGYMTIVEYLLDEAHANPLIKNNFGEAAYDVSAAAGESYICEMLEKAGRKWWHLQHTEGILNPGNKRASRFGAVYDLLDFHVTAIVILHENQRSSSLLGFYRPQFSATYLTAADTRGPWSLHPSGEPSSKEAVALPSNASNNHRDSKLSNWFWLTDWQVDYSNPRVDPTSGWQYARSFADDDSAWTPVAPTSGYNWVRRRRWVRVMKRKVDLEKGSYRGEHMPIANDIDEEDETDSQEDTNDYLLEAENIIQSVKSDMNTEQDTHDAEVLRDDIQKYNKAIDLLMEAISTDDNEFRMNQATTLIRSYSSQIDKLNAKITESGASAITSITSTITATTVDTDIALPTNLKLDLDTADDDNPWSNSSSSNRENLTVNWTGSPQNLSSIDILVPEEQKPTRVWESDVSAKACRICVKKFSFLLRRHHCRKCGMVVCDKCSPYKVFLNPSDILQDPNGVLESVSVLAVQKQRICERCYFQENMIPGN